MTAFRFTSSWRKRERRQEQWADKSRTPRRRTIHRRRSIALTAGARGRMSSLLTILALLLILFCGTYLARALINRYLDLAETEVALRVSDGDGTPTLNASEAGP